ncbi:MAG: methylmalonyl Co-A mutase-associated GTPase MeaB [Cyclobacteriaceae bacterium]
MPNDSTFRRTPKISLQAVVKGLLEQDKISLSRAITLVESKHPNDRKLALQLIDRILPHCGGSLKIGISGVPGVGKSTFIEVFGKLITAKGKKVAVLSIDPSSSRTKGSILGDKTRMTELSNDPQAYIRPTAAGSTLGGVASNTREAIMLCEAAGFDVIIVETVGVGQSETVVRDMVDYFLLLMLAGGGDELQGIKRGIMEITDHILINKADGKNADLAKKAREEYRSAIHLFPANESEWVVPVDICSATENTGVSEVWDAIEQFQKQMKASGWLEKNRRSQTLNWFHEQIGYQLRERFYSDQEIKDEIKKKEEMISSQKLSVRKAVDDLFRNRN